MPNNRPLRERLLAKIVKSAAGCWEWTGSKHDYGYGLLITQGRRYTTHRLSYVEFVGPLADDEVVCHRCDNPPCINPDHLFKGTRLENNRDSKAKGRNARGENSHSAKLTEADVLAIRASTGRNIDIAAEYGIHPNMVYYIKARKNWRHI